MQVRRPRTTRRGVLLPAAALVTALALGGCSVAQRAGSVAIVNGTPISAEAVAKTTQQYNSALVTDPSAKLTEAKAAGTLVIARFVVDYAARTGVWKPDPRYNSDLAKIPDATEDTKNLLKFIAISSSNVLAQKDVDAILETMKKADIQMDPRYGKFDATAGGFVSADHNWLAPAPAQATPQGQ